MHMSTNLVMDAEQHVYVKASLPLINQMPILVNFTSARLMSQADSACLRGMSMISLASKSIPSFVYDISVLLKLKVFHPLESPIPTDLWLLR